MRQGAFNLHQYPGGTPTAVLQDLETIWSYAIQNFLGIPLKDLKVNIKKTLILNILNLKLSLL